MNMRKMTTLVAAAALLVPAGLAAQQGHASHHPGADGPPSDRGMMDGGMMSQQAGMGMMSQQMDMGAMMQPGPRVLLRQREALELTDDQVERLERLQTRAEELRSAHRSEMTSMREEIRSILGSDDPDLERYESLLREQADHRVEMQVERAEISRDALAVLDDQQRSNLRYGMRMMRSMHGDGAMSGGMGTMKGGDTGMMGGHAGMMDRMGTMDRPPMMEMMRKMHGQMHEGDCPMAPDVGDRN